MDNEERIEKTAQVTLTANKFYKELVDKHGPHEAVEVLAFLVAGVAQLMATVNTQNKHLGYEGNLDMLLNNVSVAAKNTKIVLIGVQK